jgi:hypothetical protein
LYGIVVPQDSLADPITGPGDRLSVAGYLESQVQDDLSSAWTRISDPGDTKSELFQKNREPDGWETQTDLREAAHSIEQWPEFATVFTMREQKW